MKYSFADAFFAQNLDIRFFYTKIKGNRLAGQKIISTFAQFK